MKNSSGVPQVGKPMFSVFFYHSKSGDIMRYKFMSYDSAMDFYEKLDPDTKPTMYESVRIL